MSQWLPSKIFEQEIILPGKNVFVIYSLFVIRVLLNFLDLLGVALISYLVGAVTSGSYPSFPVDPLGILPSGATTQDGLLFFGAVATFSFLLKAALAMTVIYSTTRYSAYLEAQYSSNLLKGLLEKNKLSQGRKDPEYFQLMFTRGSRGRIAGMLSSKLELVGEGSLFLILGFVMILVSPTIGFSIIVFLALSLLLLLRFVLKNVRKQQEIVQLTDRKTLLTIRNFYSILTELRLSGRSSKHYWSQKLFDVRHESGMAFSNLRILQASPRYVLEILALFGVFLLVGLVIVFSSVSELGAQLGFAIGALFRIGTSLIPIQSALQYLQISRTDSRLSDNGADLREDLASRDEELPNPKKMREFSINVGTEVTLANSKNLVFRDALRVGPKEWVSIVGPSGIGKSSLLFSLLPGDEQKAYHEISIGFCPQSPAVLPGNMLENLLLENTSDPRRKAKAIELAESLGLHEEDFDQSGKNPGQLQISGGQLIRLGIARGLLLKPSVLILDEPTSALDAKTSNKVLDWLKQNYSGALVVATHDSEVVRRSDRIFEIQEFENELTIYRRAKENSAALGTD